MWKALVFVIACALALFLFASALPVSLAWLVVAIVLIVVKTGERKKKVWPKAIASTLDPVFLALSVLCICAMLFMWLQPDTGAALLTSEDKLAIALYRVLKPLEPSWWLYTGLLAITTWVAWRYNSSRALSSLTTANKWYGKVLGPVTMLASFTLAGSGMVLAPHLDATQARLKLEYQKAKDRKQQAAAQYLAERTVSEALLNMNGAQQTSFRQVFQMLDNSNASSQLRSALGEKYADSDAPALKQISFNMPQPAVLTQVPAEDSVVATGTLEDAAQAVQDERTAADTAETLRSQAQEGMKKIASQVLGEGSDSTLEAASAYLSKLVDLYAGTYAEMLKPILENVVQPIAGNAADAYLDKFVDYAAGKCHWAGLPHGSQALVAMQIQKDAASVIATAQMSATGTGNSAAEGVNGADDLHAAGNAGEHGTAEAAAVVTGTTLAGDAAAAADKHMAEQAAAEAAEHAAAKAAEKTFLQDLLKFGAHAL